MDPFETFFSVSYDEVVRSLTFVFNDRGRAEEAAQTAFERALRRWHDVGALERPGTWVYVVAVREGRRALQREQRHVDSTHRTDAVPFEDVAVDAAWVSKALASLPPRQRAAVVLRHLADLTVADVAAAMGVSVGTVKSTLHAAYARLRVQMDEPNLHDEEGQRNARR